METGESKESAKTCLPGSEATTANKGWEHLNDNFDKLLEAVCDPLTVKNSQVTQYGSTLTHSWILPPETLSDPFGKASEKIPHMVLTW